MNLTEILLNRRSIRRYKDEPIPEETLRGILTAGLLAPTSRNLKPCRFAVVRDKTTLEALSHAKAAGGAFLKEAGADMNHIVKTTVLLADIADFGAMNEVYAEFFEAPYPARAAFQAAALPKGARVEIEAIAEA